MAQAIIAGAMEQCTKDGYKASVVIVDKAGLVAASLRGDGTNPHTMEFARMKAYTSRTRGQTSLEFMQASSTPEGALLRQIPGVVAIGGGVPIKIGDETSAQSASLARRAAKKMKFAPRPALRRSLTVCADIGWRRAP